MRRTPSSVVVLAAMLVVAVGCGRNQDPAVDVEDVTTTTATATTGARGGGPNYSVDLPGYEGGKWGQVTPAG